MNIKYLIWDVAFNVFKMSLESREKFLKQYSFNQKIILRDGTVFKDGVFDYPKFRKSVELDSLDVIRFTNDHFITANKHICDTYIYFELLTYFIDKKISYESKVEIYRDLCEINFFDNSYNAWRADLLKAFSDALRLEESDIRSVKEEVVKSLFPNRKEMERQDYLMMTLFALLSGGEIDKSERDYFHTIQKEKWRRESDIGMTKYLNYLNRKIDLTKAEKEKILVICSTMVTCDGEINKKESVLFEFVMKELELSNNSLQSVRQFSGMSIQDVLRGESDEVISLALYFSLNLASADNVIHLKELQIIGKLLNLLDNGKSVKNGSALFYLCRFITLKYQVLKNNKALINLINSHIIDCGADLVLEAVALSEFTEDGEKVKLLKSYVANYLGPNFNKVSASSEDLLFSLCMYITEEKAPVLWQRKLRSKLKEIALNFSEVIVLDSLSYILDIVILDGHVELLEDDFFIEMCCKKNISDEMIRKEIYLSSYRNNDYIKISSFLNYASFKQI